MCRVTKALIRLRCLAECLAIVVVAREQDTPGAAVFLIREIEQGLADLEAGVLRPPTCH